MFLIAVLGGLVFVTLGDWSLFTVRETFRSPDPFRRVAYRLLLVAPLFAMLTGYSRIGGELESASSSRYVYVIAIAQTLALGFDRLTRRASVLPAVVLVVIVTVRNVGGLAVALNTRTQRTDSTRVELAQVDALLETRPDCLSNGDRPSPQWAAVVEVVDLKYWIAQGWYDRTAVVPSTRGCTGCTFHAVETSRARSAEWPTRTRPPSTTAS